MTSKNELHVVFGTGPIGMAVTEELVARGKGVRTASRSGRVKAPEGVEVVGGDANDTTFTRVASEGASVVYFILNPPYHKWPEMFPPLQDAVIEGAASAGAKLVILENMYAYGRTHGNPLTENTPFDPVEPKGAVRAKMSRDAIAAHKAGRVRVAIGRASDYYGPWGRQSHVGERVFYPALVGKKAYGSGNLDMPHTYTFVRDIGRGLVTLGEHDEALGEAWHLPAAETLTTRQFISLVCDVAGHGPNITPSPKLIMKVIGLFNPAVREVLKIFYEFEEPFIVDHSKFERAFGADVTPHREAITETLEWYRQNPK